MKKERKKFLRKAVLFCKRRSRIRLRRFVVFRNRADPPSAFRGVITPPGRRLRRPGGPGSSKKAKYFVKGAA